MPALLEKGARIIAHDPQGIREAARFLPDGITYRDSPYDVCSNADALVLMTEWNQYRALDLKRIKSLMKTALFIDLRNVYEPEAMRELGFQYIGVGRS